MFKHGLIAVAVMFAALLGFPSPDAFALSIPKQASSLAAAPSPLMADVKAGRGGYSGGGGYYRPRGNGGYRGYPGYRRYHGYNNYPRRYPYRYGHRYRCNGWAYNCRHYYNGYWYNNPWWIGAGIGFGAGAYYYDRAPVAGYGKRHVQWCYDRYRSYNARTNTWVAYSGAVRQCISPYGP